MFVTCYGTIRNNYDFVTFLNVYKFIMQKEFFIYLL